jgi:hypothetical protein
VATIRPESLSQTDQVILFKQLSVAIVRSTSSSQTDKWIYIYDCALQKSSNTQKLESPVDYPSFLKKQKKKSDEHSAKTTNTYQYFKNKSYPTPLRRTSVSEVQAMGSQFVIKSISTIVTPFCKCSLIEGVRWELKQAWMHLVLHLLVPTQ